MSPKREKSKSAFFKYALLISMITVALVAVIIFSYYAIKHSKKATRLENAITVFNTGNWKKAEKLLINAWKEDRNNEEIIVKLAQINEKKSCFYQAAYYWEYAFNLNSLEKKYIQSTVDNLSLARAHRELEKFIQKLPAEQQKNHHSTLAYSQFTLGKAEQSSTTLSKTKDKAEIGDFLSFLLDIEKKQIKIKNNPTIHQQLANFSNSTNPLVSLEATLYLTTLFKIENNHDQTEICLRRLTANNPLIALPLLGDFYFQLGRYEEACKAYSEALKYGLSIPSTIAYAEALTQTNQLNELIKLAATFKNSNKNMMIAVDYFYALIAWQQKDYETLDKILKVLPNSFKSPTALTLKFEYGIISKNPQMTADALKFIKRMPEFKSNYPLIGLKTFNLIQQLYEEKKITEAGELAQLVEQDLPNNTLILRVLLLNKLASGINVNSEITKALKIYPNDPILLNIATQNAMLSGNFPKVIEFIDTNIKNSNDNLDLQWKKVIALENLKKLNEANKLFAKLIAENSTDSKLAKLYIAFLIRQKNYQELQNYKQKLQLSSIGEFQILIDLINAVEAINNGDQKLMVDILKKSSLKGNLKVDKIEDVELLYYMAFQLALADEVQLAISLYEKLQVTLPDYYLLDLNLAELYAENGQNEKALDIAKKAWIKNPNNPMQQMCFAFRLFENKKYAEANDILSLLINSDFSTEQVKSTWQQSLEKLIEEQFKKSQYLECEKSCQKLLKFNSKNQVAIDYQQKLSKRKKAGK